MKDYDVLIMDGGMVITLDLEGKVKPCPMCGSKRIIIPYPEIDNAYTVYIRCVDCGLTGFKNFLHTVDADEAIERVKKYWNTRKGGMDED